MASKLPRFLRRALLTVFTVAAIGAPSFDSAHAYPERNITLIVCFPAGGGTDIAARLINTPLGEALGKPVIIENRGGAGGNIGITAAQRSAPDGHTLLMCSSAYVVNPSLYAQATYDPFKDFVPITLIGASPNVFVVPARSEIKTFPEFLAKAKANPGKLNWASPGPSTTPHLSGELIKLRTGIDIVHIPFAGAGPASQAAIAGQVDLYTANIGSLMGHIQGGLLRPIAQTGKTRWPDLKDIPTLAEVGIQNAETDTFQAIYAPAGVPQAVVDRLAKEIATILKRPDIREKYWTAGLEVLAEEPDVFRARIAREVPMYKEIIDKANLRIR
jgi:tripartite-type tricarboxylate transporter receptor subunit TctC